MGLLKWLSSVIETKDRAKVRSLPKILVTGKDFSLSYTNEIIVLLEEVYKRRPDATLNNAISTSKNLFSLIQKQQTERADLEMYTNYTNSISNDVDNVIKNIKSHPPTPENVLLGSKLERVKELITQILTLK